MSQGPFPQKQTWEVLLALLTAQLAGVDVQGITDKDFNQDDEIIMTPPSLRVQYTGAGFHSTTDSQRLSYEAVGRFIILCADEALQDVISQAMVSIALADQVCGILAGTRINLPSGDISEPITLVAIEPVPVDGVGMAYAVAIEVPGLAQFAGANASGFTAEGLTS